MGLYCERCGKPISEDIHYYNNGLCDSCFIEKIFDEKDALDYGE